MRDMSGSDERRNAAGATAQVPEVSPCRLCGSDAFVAVDRERNLDLAFTIARCSDCSLIYVRETYGSVSPEYTSLESEQIDPAHVWLQSQHKEAAIRRSFRLLRQALTTRPASPRLLAAGCGVGDCLYYAPSHYRLFGFDASLAQSEYARARFPNVRRAVTLSEYRSECVEARDPFDVITMWDVLEHIRKPVPFARDLTDALSPGGILLVSVPAALPMFLKSRVARLGFSLNGFFWNSNEHVSYFSPRTLRHFFDRLGLETVSIRSTGLYPRELSVFEVARRILFGLTGAFPGVAPQLLGIARRRA